MALMVLLFVDKKLVIYYLFGSGIWLLLSRIIPMLQYTAILHAQILVYTYIIVIRRELDFLESRSGIT